jgi:hypothetical protein
MLAANSVIGLTNDDSATEGDCSTGSSVLDGKTGATTSAPVPAIATALTIIRDRNEIGILKSFQRFVGPDLIGRGRNRL